MNTMKWYDWMQYAAMLLMAASMPIAWRLGLLAALLLAGASFVKLVAERRVPNSALDRPLCWAMVLVLVYLLACFVSVFYSSDTQMAWNVMSRKVVLMIFPLCFLLTDTRYLTATRMRNLGYALLFSMVGVFLFFVGKALINISNGATWDQVTNMGFDPRHHAYTSLYAVTALLFVYNELRLHWGELRGGLRGWMIASTAMIILYMMLVNSRAGILTLCFAAVCCLLHLALHHRRVKAALIAAVLVAAEIVGASFLPGHTNRFDSTVVDVTRVDADTRIQIYVSSTHAAQRHLFFGNGVGDYRDDLRQVYCEDEFLDGVTHNLNAHNQYFETLLSVGLVGLVIMMVYLLMPLCIAWRRRHRCLIEVAVLTAIVLANLLFESMLERQMGLLFIGYIYTIMVLILSLQENKFGQTEKS